tara:strand:- start:1119 stop:1724 length:606 start_codon:yes stop_codon:yes gene_type:complete
MSALIYTRVSTSDQKTQRQLSELLELTSRDGVSEKIIMKEKISGTKPLFKRKDGSKIEGMVQNGEINCLYVHEISRLGRSVADVANTIEFLIDNNCNLRVMDAGLSLLNNDGEVNISARMVINVLVSLAQNERDLLSQRTKSGLRQAKANGKVLGRSEGDCSEEAKIVKKMLLEGLKPSKVLKSTTLSKSQVYRINAKLKK